MRTPNVNPLGLPTRYKAFDTPLPQFTPSHWSWIAANAKGANRRKLLAPRRLRELEMLLVA